MSATTRTGGLRRARATAAALAAVSIVALLTACAPPPRPDVYAPGQVARAQSVEPGIVESTREVRIAAAPTGAGAATGAIVGSIAGSGVGHGWRSSFLGAIVGAIFGGVVGGAIEENAAARTGVEVTVRLDSGALVAVVQDVEPSPLRPGDRVRVLSDGATTRVTR